MNGEIQSRFLSQIGLPSGTAPVIVDAVLSVHFYGSVTCSIATDGVSVIIDCCNGITTQLRRKKFVSIHCIAHRLALASSQATDAVSDVKQHQLYLNI